MKTTKKSTSRWSVIWKTLAAVLMLLFIVLGCIRLYYVISSWHYHRSDGFTQSLSFLSSRKKRGDFACPLCAAIAMAIANVIVIVSPLGLRIVD